MSGLTYLRMALVTILVSTLTIGAVATMVLAGAWVTIAARKKED